MADKAYLNIDDVARWFGVTSGTVYRLAQRGDLPGFKVGGQWRFSEEMLEAWVADQVTVERLRAEDAASRAAPAGPQRTHRSGGRRPPGEAA